MKGCFESGQHSNDLSHVQVCMAHVKTGEDDVLKKVRLCFFKSGGRQTSSVLISREGTGCGVERIRKTGTVCN